MWLYATESFEQLSQVRLANRGPTRTLLEDSALAALLLTEQH